VLSGSPDEIQYLPIYLILLDSTFEVGCELKRPSLTWQPQLTTKHIMLSASWRNVFQKKFINWFLKSKKPYLQLRML